MSTQAEQQFSMYPFWQVLQYVSSSYVNISTPTDHYLIHMKIQPT